MRRLLTPRTLHVAHLLSIGVPLCWWTICYIIWVHRGCRAVLPFISEFDMYEPEDTIFTVGLSLTAVILLVRMLQLFMVQQEQVLAHELGPRWILLNRFSLLPGSIGVVCATWLAHTPWNEKLYLHEYLANCIFYGGVIWCICATALTWRLSRERPELKNGLLWRIRGSLLAAIGLIGMSLTAGREIHSPEYDRFARLQLSKEDPMEYCTESYSVIMDTGAAFEWIMVLGILFVTWTFASDLRATPDSDPRDDQSSSPST